MNEIQQVRYGIPMQAPRGFMSYAADAAQAYYKKKKEVEDAKRAEMMAIFPTLAANNEVRRAKAGEQPDMMLGGVPWMMEGSTAMNVPVDVGGSTVNFPIRSLADYNTLSTIRKREAPPTIPAGTAFQAALTAPDFWKRYKGENWQKQAAKDIYGLQQEYNSQVMGGGTTLPATKAKHAYVGEYNGEEVYSNDQVNWYDADGNLVQE